MSLRGPCRNVWAVAMVSVLELYRRRDVYVAFVLAFVTIVPLASVSMFGVGGVVRYLWEVTLLLIWLFSIAVGVTAAARQIPREVETRTILPLLAKPIHRAEFVLGKFVGAALATGSCVILLYACYMLLGGLKDGSWCPAALPHALLLHLCFVALLTAMVLFGSTFLTPSGNVTCSSLVVVAMLLFGEKLPVLASRAPAPGSWLARLIHLIAPHFEFFDMRLRLVHGWEPLTPAVLLIVLAYTVLYTAAFLGGAILLFGRKRL